MLIKSKIFFILFILSAALILIFSLFISVPNIREIKSFDKIEHTAAYMFLGFLFIFSFTKENKILLISIIACTAYGGLIEILQGFLGRNPEIIDLAADFTGAVIGSFAGRLIQKKINRKNI
jgi:VanZ family protein